MDSTKLMHVDNFLRKILGVLSSDQQMNLIYELELDFAKVAGTALTLLELPQMIEMAAHIATELIKSRSVELAIGTERIEEGILEYQVTGDTESLDIVADSMVEKGTLEFEKDLDFHRVSAVITGAQIVASELGPDDKEAQRILSSGKKLADLEPGTYTRAEKTKEFLDALFKYINANL